MQSRLRRRVLVPEDVSALFVVVLTSQGVGPGSREAGEGTEHHITPGLRRAGRALCV